jgi:ABC-type multidrug transport system permease subunit
VSAARLRPLWVLTRTRVREFLREPEAIFWVFFFPVLLAVALGLAFRNQPPAPALVGVEEAANAAARRAALAASGHVEPRVLPRAEAERRLRTGKLVLVVLATEPPTYLFNPTRADTRTAELEVEAALEKAAGRTDAFTAQRQEIREPGSRYIDFLLPGLLGMNLMSTGLWSIGFSLVQARSGRLLKRFVAAPVARWQLLASHVLARFVFLALEVVALVAFGTLAMGVPVRGNVAALGVVLVLGGLAFAGLGLLIAARPRTIEGINGVMNLIAVPMWLCSGIFFSRERFPDALQPVIRALPLTALNDALRGIMLEGAGLASLSTEMLVLTGWGVLAFVAAVAIFRWD